MKDNSLYDEIRGVKVPDQNPMMLSSDGFENAITFDSDNQN